MKSFTTKMTIAAAALMAAAGMASAQTMKAEIPFSFAAGGAVLAPGGYDVTLLTYTSGTRLLQIRNSDTHKTILAMPFMPAEPPKEWNAGEGKLSFECGASQCNLVEAWSGQPGYASYKFSSPKKNEPRHLAVIVMRSEKGE